MNKIVKILNLCNLMSLYLIHSRESYQIQIYWRGLINCLMIPDNTSVEMLYSMVYTNQRWNVSSIIPSGEQGTSSRVKSTPSRMPGRCSSWSAWQLSVQLERIIMRERTNVLRKIGSRWTNMKHIDFKFPRVHKFNTNLPLEK